MKKAFIPICAAFAAIGALLLAACSPAGMGGNDINDINAAMETLGQKFGTEFRLEKRKAAGGAVCSITARCPDTGDRDIFIFQADKDHSPQTDYMYIRYGREALAKITELSEKACPGCKVIVNERQYNHFTSNRYDKDSGLEGYLRDNDLDADVLMPRMLDKGELEIFYHSLEMFLNDEGIHLKELTLGCPQDFDSVVPPDHILCTNEDQYSGTTVKNYTYSAYCPNYITKNDDSFDSSSPYMVIIDGQRVRN